MTHPVEIPSVGAALKIVLGLQDVQLSVWQICRASTSRVKVMVSRYIEQILVLHRDLAEEEEQEEQEEQEREGNDPLRLNRLNLHCFFLVFS